MFGLGVVHGARDVRVVRVDRTWKRDGLAGALPRFPIWTKWRNFFFEKR